MNACVGQDNDVVVRDGEVLETRGFLDAQTTSFSIRVPVHVPSNGLTSVLTLGADCSGLTIEPSVEFTHLGFVESDKVKDVQLMYGMVFLCIALLILLNLWTLYAIRRDKREWDVPIQQDELVDMAWDAVQIIILIVFCVISMREVPRTEGTARDVTQVLSSVPFADPNIDFQSKVSRFFDAMDEVQDVLASQKALTTFAFVIMVLMLVRILEATGPTPRPCADSLASCRARVAPIGDLSASELAGCRWDGLRPECSHSVFAEVLAHCFLPDVKLSGGSCAPSGWDSDRHRQARRHRSIPLCSIHPCLPHLMVQRARERVPMGRMMVWKRMQNS